MKATEKRPLHTWAYFFPRGRFVERGSDTNIRRMYILDESLSGELVSPSPTKYFHVGKKINALGLREQKERLLCHFE